MHMNSFTGTNRGNVKITIGEDEYWVNSPSGTLHGTSWGDKRWFGYDGILNVIDIKN